MHAEQKSLTRVQRRQQKKDEAKLDKRRRAETNRVRKEMEQKLHELKSQPDAHVQAVKFEVHYENVLKHLYNLDDTLKLPDDKLVFETAQRKFGTEHSEFSINEFHGLMLTRMVMMQIGSIVNPASENLCCTQPDVYLDHVGHEPALIGTAEDTQHEHVHVPVPVPDSIVVSNMCCAEPNCVVTVFVYYILAAVALLTSEHDSQA